MELTTTKNEIPVKKTNLMSQYDSRRGNMKLTSISFFQRLQTKTAKEVKVALKYFKMKKKTKHFTKSDLIFLAFTGNISNEASS